MNEVTDRETGREIVGWVGGQCGREKRSRRCGWVFSLSSLTAAILRRSHIKMQHKLRVWAVDSHTQTVGDSISVGTGSPTLVTKIWF